MSYRQLDEAQIIRTIERLTDRIGERFPDAGLRKVARELLGLARDTAACVDYLRRPNWPLRLGIGAAIVAIVGLLTTLALSVRVTPVATGAFTEIAQGIEAVVNDIIFVGIAIYFLLSIETRLKRRRALRTIHELRSIAHIVDMHQLTKDPERLLLPQPDTPSSPARTMTVAELGRYLDYCSELLSVTSKIAALLVQHFDDAVVLAGVNEVETVTTGLSSKIWQKITILDRAHGGQGLAPPAAASLPSSVPQVVVDRGKP